MGAEESKPTEGNYLVIWTDRNIDENNEESQKTQAQLEKIIKEVKICKEPAQCINCLNDMVDKKVVVICSGSLGESLVSEIHNMANVVAIYIFCGNKERHEVWAKKWSKVLSVSVTIEEICESMKQSLAVIEPMEQTSSITDDKSVISIGQTSNSVATSQAQLLLKHTGLFDETSSDTSESHSTDHETKAAVQDDPNYDDICSSILNVKNERTALEEPEQQIQQKNQTIAQLEAVIQKKDQQLEEQDSMIKQFQAMIEKQTEQVSMLMKLVNQNGAPTSSLEPPPENIFEQQSLVVQDQLMNIPENIVKVSDAQSCTRNQDVSVIESNASSAVEIHDDSSHIPTSKISLPTSCLGPNSSAVHFISVYHPDQHAVITKPIIDNPYDINNYGTYKVNVYSQDSQHVIAETLLTVIPEIEICVPRQIVVRDSINNIIAGGIVTLKRVGDNAVVFTGNTDHTGTVTLSDTLPDGAYEVEVYSANNSKLQRLKFVMLIFQNRRQGLINRCIGRNDLVSNQMHIVLEWGEEPKDLDSHLFSSDGKHVYFSRKTDGEMTLDCDVTHGHGPETTTFMIQPNLKYVYAVNRYSDEPKLTQSKARVTFNFDAQQTQITKVGTQSKLVNGEVCRIPEISRPAARFWIVCMIDGSTKRIKFFPNAFEDDNDYNSTAIGTKYFTA